jgi:mono/diheme cytochrome c family protein
VGKEAPGHAYDISGLNVIFALSSIALFVTTVWMIWNDYSREWKGYQRAFARLERETTRRQFDEAQATLDQAKLGELEQELQTANGALAQNKQAIDELESKRQELENDRYLADIEERELKSKYDSKKFYFEEGAHAPLGKGVDQEEFGELEQEFFTARGKRIALDYELEQAERELREIRAQRTQIEGERKSLTERIDLITRKLDTIRVSFPNLFRNLPIVDFIDPSIEIKQVLVQHVTEDLNFMQVPRVDRCMTCHLGIDNPDYADAPQPFRTHPQLDLYVNRESPHSVDDFGCTGCHNGRGRATTFSWVTHTPRDEVQAMEWEEKYDWEADHYWDRPMYSADFSESGCLKCHADTVHVPKATDFNRGRDLYEKAGCWGCHNTRGFEDRRKVGPNLDHVVSKTTPEWAARWVKDPKSFKPSTFMPRFWNLDNNLDADVGARNNTEVAAIVAYVFEQAEPIAYPQPVPSGSPDRGKQLVESVGCLGCHITDESEAAEAPLLRRHGPSLAGLGSKVNRQFLFNWLKDPKHYWPETFMPNLRLTDGEAADITAHLISQRNTEFEELPVPSADPAALDEVTLEFLRTGLPDRLAEERLEGMSEAEKLTYSGENLIRRYGCFGCHDIKGFENAQKIGVDLSDWGSKMVTRLDFGYIDIEHTRRAWLEQKLRAPRGYDQGRVKAPQEKLRMGYFGFNDQQIADIARNVLAQVRDEFPLEAVKRLDAAETVAERGRRVIHEYNCKGCHLIDGEGGAIYETIEDPGMRPPNLNTQGLKTRADWLFHFLKEPSTVRFWLNVRMPTFGLTDDQANTLVRGFMAIDDADPFETKDRALDPVMLSQGRALLARLRCEQCHVPAAAGTMSASQLAPSFLLTPERLRPEWVVRWLEDPQAIAPGTQMPQFWPVDDEGNILTPVPEYLDGDAMKQMEAVATYLARYGR